MGRGMNPQSTSVHMLQPVDFRILVFQIANKRLHVDRPPDDAVERIHRCIFAAVLVQVDPRDEPQKGGCAPHAVPELVEQLGILGLDVRGLMAVGPTPEDDLPLDAASRAFESVAELADRLDLPERSMGMSDDLEAAVAAGSTMIRVGRGLFGDRPRR